MAEDFVTASLVLPGTYIRVRADALIGVGGISVGNIGIVGETDAGAAGTTQVLSAVAEAEVAFGPPEVTANSLNLTAQIAQLYRNGAGVVIARGVEDAADQDAMSTAFNELLKEDVQILVAPSLSTSDALAVLAPVVETAENSQKNVIAVIGADGASASDIADQATTNDRIVMTAPGYEVFNPAAPDTPSVLPATYMAAPVAGLISSLPPHVSPTNKVLPGVTALSEVFSYAERTSLTQGRIMAVDLRNGARIVRGLTTDDGGFTQLTTRRITDFMKTGVMQVGNAFVGRLNNERVRAAMASAIDGFLTTMKVDEQLTDYRLEVTATRRDEIEGRAIVNILAQPTFSIDFVAVTIVLQ